MDEKMCRRVTPNLKKWAFVTNIIGEGRIMDVKSWGSIWIEIKIPLGSIKVSKINHSTVDTRAEISVLGTHLGLNQRLSLPIGYRGR